MRIQHNIMAMNAYRNYSSNTSALAKNLEKLSSGYKINRAGDDAAGLAISEKMRAQITGLETAQKNAKDGISLVQTAEGALTEVHDMLNRMVELADQSANGTYDNDTDRANLQKEFDALRSEIDRISKATNFNGINLLDGSQAGETKAPEFSLSNLTVGDITTAGNTFVAGTPGSKGAFSVDLKDFSVTNTSNVAQTVTITVGSKAFAISVEANKTLTGQEVADKMKALMTAGATVSATSATFNMTQSGTVLTFTMSDIPTTIANDADNVNFAVSITAAGADMTHNNAINHATTVQSLAAVKTQEKAAHLSFTLAAGDVKDGGAVKIGDQTYVFAVGAESKYKGAAGGKGITVVDLTDIEENTAGATKLEKVTAALTEAAKNNKLFTVGHGAAADGKLTLTTKLDAVDENGLVTLEDGTKIDFKKSTAADYDGLIKKGSAPEDLSTETTGGLQLQIGDTSDSFNQLKVSINKMDCASLGIDASQINIDLQGNAADSVKVLKDAINSVSSTRGDLGALQNRLEHTINNLSVMQENIQDAEASIRDVDVAQEMMSYTKNNILVQSAQAMLAQANQVPQGVLQLLQ